MSDENTAMADGDMMTRPVALSRDLTLFFDGGCEPVNPGGIGTYGWYLLDRGVEVKWSTGVASSSHIMTNNLCEYQALGFALRWLSDQGWKGRLKIFGDSKLIVHQIRRDWKCNKKHLQALRQRCWELLREVCPDGYDIEWIPREENARADELSRMAYEDRTGSPCPERGRKGKKRWQRMPREFNDV
jgi:ribonuclease HI